MKIEDQVCSLEHANKLKELGVKQNGLIYWLRKPFKVRVDENRKTGYYQQTILEYEYALGNPLGWNTPGEDVMGMAFTGNELLDMLPAFIDTKKNEPFNGFWLKLNKRSAKNIQYIINYESDTSHVDEVFFRNLLEHNIYDEKLADCLAKMLIYLLENKFMELKNE